MSNLLVANNKGVLLAKMAIDGYAALEATCCWRCSSSAAVAGVSETFVELCFGCAFTYQS